METKGHRARGRVYVCPPCGAEFFRWDRNVVGIPPCCSVGCAKRWQASQKPRARVDRTCQTCGRSFQLPPSRAVKEAARYCSLACRTASPEWRANIGGPRSEQARANIGAARRGKPLYKKRKPIIERVCEQCGETFRVSRDAGLKRLAAQRLCGIRCRGRYLREHPEIQAAYRGGADRYFGPGWREQARRARERDNHTCQDCGKAQRRPLLAVHHIIPRRLFSGDYESANRLDNLVSLCASCHRRREAELDTTLFAGEPPRRPVYPEPTGRRGMAKLTPALVREIRRDYAAGGISHRTLAARYEVSHGIIGQVVRGERWKGVAVVD